MIARYKLVFNRKNQLNKNGEGLIQIEINKSGKRKYISSEVYLKPNEWNLKKLEVNINNPNSNQLNNYLRKCLIDLENNELKSLNSGKELQLEDINLNPSDNTDFFDFFEKEITKSSSCSSTKNLYTNTLKNLKEIRKSLKFNEIDYSLITDFEFHLKSKNLHINTINKRHSALRTFLNIAMKKGLLDVNKYPYRDFKLKKIPSERIALEPNEISNLENLKFSTDTEIFKIIRDMFLFSCYTGLRFAEIQLLSKKDIEKNDGSVYLNIKQNKTQKFLQLPLHLLFNGKVLEILSVYEKFDRETIFPKLTNQYTNRILKLISFISKIETNKLTFHIARHTFGTYLAESTLDPYLIKELMNHADIKTSMLYIHHSKKRIENKLKNVEWK